MHKVLKLSLILSLIIPSFAIAKPTVKKIKKLKFSIDKSFDCSEINTGTFCISKNKDIIVNITARTRQKDDSLRKYKTHLESSMAKTVNYTSKFIEVKNTFLNKVKWIYAKHYQSEFLGYYTQYFATVKGANAYLVSISYKKKEDTRIDLITKTLKL
jgi:hypothetical protein